MTEDSAEAPAEAEPDRTAAELRSDTRSANRHLALALIGVAAVLLAGAFGVAFLVIYAPY